MLFRSHAHRLLLNLSKSYLLCNIVVNLLNAFHLNVTNYKKTGSGPELENRIVFVSSDHPRITVEATQPLCFLLTSNNLTELNMYMIRLIKSQFEATQPLRNKLNR